MWITGSQLRLVWATYTGRSSSGGGRAQSGSPLESLETTKLEIWTQPANFPKFQVLTFGFTLLTYDGGGDQEVHKPSHDPQHISVFQGN